MSKYTNKMEQFQLYDVREGMYLQPKDQDIKQIESEIGYTLPPDYVDFLTYYGGFSPLITAEYFFQGKIAKDNGSVMGVIYGFMPGDCYDLVENHQTYKGRMPHNIIPIAEDGMGGQICLSLDGKDKGSVYFWDHDFEETIKEGKEPGYSNLYLIARSFDDFINSLKVFEDDEDE
jgi:hypothetical protein